MQENDSILRRFGSAQLGQSIPVTSVVRTFTVENELANDVKFIKLNQDAVKRENDEFIEPLIYNCTRLTMTLKDDVEGAEIATKSILEVVLRVKNKKLIDRISDLLSEYLLRLKISLVSETFSSMWKYLYEIVISFYQDSELDCRSLAPWRLLLSLLEVLPDKFNETMVKLLEVWSTSTNETLIVRSGKAIKALISSSKFDSSVYYADIIKHAFESVDKSFPIASNTGHLVGMLCNYV